MKKIFLVLIIFIIIFNIYGIDIKSFINYTQVNDLESDRNKIYCATNNGIIFYSKSKENFEFFTDKKSNLAGQNIYSIIYNQNSDELFLFSDEGVYLKHLSSYWDKIYKSIGKVNRYYLMEDQTYFKNTQGDTYIFKRGNFHQERNNFSMDIEFKDIHHVNYKFPKNSYKINDRVDVFESEKINNYKYIVATKKGFLLIYDRMRGQYQINHGSIFDRKIVNVFSSKNAVYFLGEYVNIYKDNKFNSLKIDELEGNINDIATNDNNSFYIATKSNGIYLWDNSLKRAYMKRDGLLSNNIKKVLNENGYLISLSRYGVTIINKYNGNKKNLKDFKYYNLNNISYENNYLAMHKKDKVIIYNMKKESAVEISAVDLYNDVITDVFIKNNIVYVGGNSALSKYNISDQTIENIKSFDGFINDIFINGEYIYVGSNRGLYLYNFKEEIVKSYDEFEGLSSNIVKKVFIFDGKIFVTTDKGLDIIE